MPIEDTLPQGAASPDPYLWLEDVDGPEAMAWVRARNAETALELEQGPEVPGTGGRHPAHPRLGRQAALRVQGRGLLLQLLARRRAPARDLAAHHPGRIPQGRTGLGDGARPGRPGPGGGRKLGVPRRPVPAPRMRALPGAALPGRVRRPRGAGVRSARQGLRAGRLQPAPGQELGELDRAGRAVRRHRFRPRLHDRLGIPALCPDLAPRHGAGGGPDGVRGPAGGHGGGRLPRSHPRASSGTSWCAGPRSSPRSCSCLGREGPTRIDLPPDAEPDVHREWLLVRLRSPWTVGARTYPAGALLATGLEAFLAGQRRFRVLFRPTSARSLEGWSWTRHHLILNLLEHVKSRLFLLTPGPGPGSASRSPAHRPWAASAPRASTPWSRTTGS